MDIFTYLMSKNGKNTSVHGDLMSYLLGQKNGIPKEASGTSITIEALKTRINKLIMTKESTQKTTTGKNLLPYTENFEETKNNLKLTANEGVYTIQNQPTQGTTTTELELISTYTIKENDYLHIMNDVANANCVIRLVFSDNTATSPAFLSINRIFSLSDFVGKTVTKISFYANTSYNGEKITLTPMICNTSVSTNFEPYTGGIPAPNPSFPQEINVITNNIIVNISDGTNSKNVTIPLNDNEIVGIGEYKDELIVDKKGQCYINKKTNKIDSYNGETITTDYMSTTGGLDTGATIYYVLDTPQLIDLENTVDLKLYKGTNIITNSENATMTLYYY